MARRIPRADLLAMLALLVLALAAYGRLLDPAGMLADYDAFVYFYPLRAYAAMAVQAGRLPLWNPDSFLGTPFIANPQTAVFYPFTWLFFWLPVPFAYSLNLALHVVLAGVFFYLFCRISLDLRPLASLVGGSAFMLGGVLSGQYGHLNQVSAVAWLPLVLLVGERAVARRSLRLAAAAGALVGLQLLAGHPQQSYMTLMLLGWVALWRAWPLTRARLSWTVGLLLLSVLLGIGLAAVQLLPTAELAAASIRGSGLEFRDAVAGSLLPWLIPRALLPSFVNDLGSTEYLGYIGVIPLLLAGLALGAGDRRRLALAVPLAVGGLLLAVGGSNPLYGWLYTVVPGFSSFRVPARWLLVYSFGACTLAALGLDWLLSRRDFQLSVRGWARLAGTLGVLGTAVLLAYLGGARATRSLQLAWAGLALAGTLLAVASASDRLKRFAAPLLVLVTAVELWAAGGDLPPRWPVPVEAYAQPRDSTMFVQARLGGERFLSIATEEYELKESPDYRESLSHLSDEALVGFLVAAKRNEILTPNLNLLYGIADVDGYDGGLLPTRRWLQLGGLLVPPAQLRTDGALISRMDSLPPRRLMDLLNLRFVLAGRAKDYEADGVVYDRSVLTTLRPGERLDLDRVPNRAFTAVGLISSLAGAAVPDGVVVAELELTRADGSLLRVPMLAGRDTTMSRLPSGASVPETLLEVRPWNSAGPDDPTEFQAQIPAAVPDLRRLSIVNRSVANVLSIRAVTLIDERQWEFSPLVLDDQLERANFFDMKVFEYPGVLGRAYLVHTAVEAADTAALELMAGPAFDPRQQTLVEPGTEARVVSADSAGDRADVLEQAPERVRVRTRLDADALLVLSDPYYPGWRAWLDGRPVRLLRANVALRAVEVPAGEHEVIFTYEPDSFRLGALVSAATGGLVVVLLLVGPGIGRGGIMRGRRGGTDETRGE